MPDKHPKFFVNLYPSRAVIRNDRDGYVVIRDVEGTDDYTRFMCFGLMYELHVFKRRNGWTVNIHPVPDLQNADVSVRVSTTLEVKI